MTDIKQNTDYGKEIQKLYLEIMLTDAETFIRCQSIYNADLFDRTLKKAATFIHDYVSQHNAMPTFDMVNASTGVDLANPGKLEEPHYDWLLNEFETFTRHRSLEKAILESADLLESGEYGTVEGIIKQAVQIGLQKDLGTDYWRNPQERLEEIRNTKGQISTGWPTLDRLLYGGFQKGELEILAGSSGSGKSLFLANLGVNWVLDNLNVLYITLELSEGLVSKRMDSMVTGISSRDILKNIEDVALKVSMVGKKSGAYQVKYMPSGSTINDIRSFMKEYQVKFHRKFDVVIVDYLDLMMPVSKRVSPENLFVKDKYISEELRNLAMETDTLLVSASQLNRCLSLDTIVIRDGVETKISDIHVGDKILSDDGPVTVTEKLPVTTQKVYKIKTKSGKEIICSADHKFPSDNTLKSINTGLSVGDTLMINRSSK